MRLLITGATGTVGRAVCEAVRARCGVALPFERTRFALDDEVATGRYFDSLAPTGVVHLAIASRPTGAPDEHRVVMRGWPAVLARCADRARIPLVAASTVMVYTDATPGPYSPDTPADAREGYGAEKLAGEGIVRTENAAAVVARLGWQIGAVGSNNMVDWGAARMREDGVVRASGRWMPACSFVDDTAEALIGLLGAAGGVYLVDANRGWSFFEIASALGARHGWRVERDDAYAHDQRMQDPRVAVAPLSVRLPELRPLA